MPPICRLKEQYNITQKHLLGTIGRLHPDKGFSELIRAFQAANLSENIALIIIGSGEEEQHLKTLIGQTKNIHLIPAQANVSQWYSLFDAYLSNSKSETFGLTLLEAMHHNLPILTTATEGAKTVLHGQPHTLITPEDLPKILQNLKFPTQSVKYNLTPFRPIAVQQEVEKFYRKIIQEMVKA